MNDRDLFAELVPLDPAHRATLLARTCALDPAQRARMEALLAALESDPVFLKTPLVSPPSLLSELKPGDRIGAYTLRQKLGEGGCGIVWMAEQEQPIRRRVALKVIKLGMDTREVIARFEAERQALALMEHPNIARVLDAGATESGRPFFVMELVRGVPITKYCDELAVSTRARLDLFIQVCHAVQHAHQKGIIHRDLKPSNILVSLTDAGAVPKVIDFGIAKATQGKLADETIFTSFQQFIGTPAYISPEQAELSGLDVDTRSDIYSLGVLLYEMLTGRTPFDPRELAEAGLDEMRRRIRETEPPRPSTRLGTLQAELLGIIARHRHTDPLELVQQVRGDLDWIVMRCLEKDRTRRYPSASALGEDVRRHLHDEPVEARPPSRTYRLRKLVRRNRLVFALAGAVSAALVIGAMAATWQAIRASHAEQVALRAGAEQTRLRQVAEQLQANEAGARARAEASELAARRSAYAADMRTIQQVLDHSNYSYARSLLDRHRPRQPDEPDFRGWEWRYWWQHVADDSADTLSNDAAISALAASADGEWLAGVRRTTPTTHDVVVWNLRTRERRTLETTVASRAAPLPARLIAFAPTAPLLAVAARTGRDGEQSVLELWEPATGRRIRQWPLPAECRAVHFAPDGETLLTWIPQPVEKKHHLIVWRVADGSTVRTHDELPITTWLAVDPQWRRAVACGLKMQAFDVSSGEQLWEFPGIYANALGFSPDGEVFASAAFMDHGTIQLRDAATGHLLGSLEGHRGPVLTLEFSPDGRTLVSGSQDQTIRVWNVKSRTRDRTLVGSSSHVRAVALLPQGRALVSASSESVAVWDLGQSSRRRGPVELDAGIVYWQFGADSASLVTVNRNGDVIRRHGERWASEDHRLNIGRIRSGDDAQSLIHLSVEPPLVAVSKAKDAVVIWDWERRIQVGEIQTGAYQALIAGLIDHGRKLVLSCQAAPGSDSTHSEWEIASGRRVRDWPPEPGGRTVAVSADGQSAVMLGENECSLLDVASGTVQPAGIPHGRRVFAGTRSSISPDGRILVVPGMANVGVFELPALQPVTTLTGYMDNTLSTAFSPDGRRLAVSSAFSTSLVLYDPANWERVLMLDTPEARISQVRISPDGNALGVMPLNRGVVYLWRAPSWAEIEAAATRNPVQRTGTD